MMMQEDPPENEDLKYEIESKGAYEVIKINTKILKCSSMLGDIDRISQHKMSKNGDKNNGG